MEKRFWNFRETKKREKSKWSYSDRESRSKEWSWHFSPFLKVRSTNSILSAFYKPNQVLDSSIKIQMDGNKTKRITWVSEAIPIKVYVSDDMLIYGRIRSMNLQSYIIILSDICFLCLANVYKRILVYILYVVLKSWFSLNKKKKNHDFLKTNCCPISTELDAKNITDQPHFIKWCALPKKQKEHELEKPHNLVKNEIVKIIITITRGITPAQARGRVYYWCVV